MSQTYIPVELRHRLLEEGRYRCGYCLTPTFIIGRPMIIDHIIPEAKGGKTKRENLWPACRRCNEIKGIRTHGTDSLTKASVPLFNPRTQDWFSHFAWSEDGTMIQGLTPTGRATIQTLNLNNDEIVASRSFWVHAGWHPPEN